MKRQLLRVVHLIAIAAVVSAMSVVFIFGYDLLTQHAYFNARNISITGNRTLSDPQVLAQAGIGDRTNIFAVNLSVARKRLLSHPWIREAAVSRRLPDTIHITIEEQQPLAIVDLGRKFLVNPGGDIFKEWSAPDPSDLPLVCGLEFSDLKSPGESASDAFLAVMNVLQMGSAGEHILSNRRIKKIQVDRETGLTLFTADGTKAIRIGYHDYADKYKILETVMSRLNRHNELTDFETIDLNNPNRVVVQPVKAASTVHHKKEA